MPHRRVIVSALVVVAFAALGSACSTFSRTVATQVQQAARIAAPSPGMAAAPLTPYGRVAVEGGIEGAFGPFAVAPVAVNQVAHLVPTVSARGRVLFRPWRYAEVGLGGVVYLPVATVSTAEGLDDAVFRNGGSGRFDMNLRVVFNPASAVRVGTSLGLGFTSVPFVQTGSTTDVATTTWSWSTEPRSTSTTTASTWARNGSFLEPQLTWGLFVTGDPHRRLGLLGGVTLQNQRVTPGRESILRSCSTSRDSTCEVTRVQDESPGIELPLLQTFVSAELRLGRASVVGTLHAALPSSPLVAQSGLVGGSLDLRYTFGR
jgi:hypothetical protein